MPRGLSSESSARIKAKKPARAQTSELPAVLFDLDGTLIDSVYQHVQAWHETLRDEGITLPIWKIHRRVGMSGKSFLREMLREIALKRRGIKLTGLENGHNKRFGRMIPTLKPLPGARELLQHLHRSGVRVAIATTGNRKQTLLLLKKLRVPSGTPVVTGDDVERAKPSPDIFVAAAQALKAPIHDCIVVGDSVWDLLAAGRKGALGVGLLSGGYGPDELERAGAFRVYCDPADMLMHLEQLGLAGVD
jgi:HAD superfamily hydrolase (TIGR01509 family)